jgi:hypothetical protein
VTFWSVLDSSLSSLRLIIETPPIGATELRYVWPLIVTATRGRLPAPSASTTSSGPRMPVAVLPLCSIGVRKRIGPSLSAFAARRWPSLRSHASITRPGRARSRSSHSRLRPIPEVTVLGDGPGAAGAGSRRRCTAGGWRATGTERIGDVLVFPSVSEREAVDQNLGLSSWTGPDGCAVYADSRYAWLWVAVENVIIQVNGTHPAGSDAERAFAQEIRAALMRR